jgi:hypothetical protein
VILAQEGLDSLKASQQAGLPAPPTEETVMDDANAAATKGDLHSAVEQLRSEMQHQFDELKETMRDSQTEILKAFYATHRLRMRN